jgi:hypothetical protein
MNIQQPTQTPTPTCVYCGEPMKESSPFAEHTYWESDGVGGHIWSCGACPEGKAKRGPTTDSRPGLGKRTTSARRVIYNPRMIRLRSARSAAIWATSASDGSSSVR